MVDGVHPEHYRLHQRLDAVETSLSTKLQSVIDLQRIANGRTTKMEHVIFGVPDRTLRDGTKDRGMQGQVQANQHIIDSLETGIKVGKWAAATFGAAALGLVGNLAAGLF